MRALLATTASVGTFKAAAGKLIVLAHKSVINKGPRANQNSFQHVAAFCTSFPSSSTRFPRCNPCPPRLSMQPQNGDPMVLPGPSGDSGRAAEAGVPGPVRIAVGQMTSNGDQEANLATCARLAKDAAEAGCRMLFLPECFSFIGESQAESVAASQPLNGPLMEQYRQLARSLGLWLSLGGFQETGPDPGHIYNTHVVLDSNGELVARYRKIHLFDVDVPSGPVLMESRSTAPGTEAVAVDTPAGRLGLTTCYDLRFPELFAHLAWERGAQVLAVPSAFTVITGAAHWEVLLRARAIECQAYVVAAAQAGRHNNKRESYGHALVVDPWGTVVARLPDPGVTGIAVAEVDFGLLARTRERMPCQLHREKGRAAYANDVAGVSVSARVASATADVVAG
ncbi:hypothetical protein Vafri_17747 [Volvox africanus]|uniref:CN hydrolase domain-containing protein n=1 Tax=Volvox africanus TaxID=51714 RepID=A0A8J4F7R6_9CHLO|nr:hypothetical protein Vafri_17747 [Volvox africanus]